MGWGSVFCNMHGVIRLCCKSLKCAALVGIDTFYLQSAHSHLQLPGPPACSFRLLNVRQDVRFALVRNGLQFPTIAAWSEPVAVQQPNLPMQGHLSLTGVPG